MQFAREACKEYAAEVEKLAYKLMELIALSLGLAPTRFRGFFEHNTNSIRLNHYPPCPYPHLALGIGQHKDIGVLTVMAEDDVGGFEFKRKSDGEWILVKPILNSLTINVGDMIQVARLNTIILNKILVTRNLIPIKSWYGCGRYATSLHNFLIN